MTEHRVFAVQIGPVREHDVNLAVGKRGISEVSDPDSAFRMLALPRDLRNADRFAARRRGAASPLGLLHRIARLRIAPLNDKARNRAVKALAVVEAARHELDHVRDGFRRIVRIRFELEGAF